LRVFVEAARARGEALDDPARVLGRPVVGHAQLEVVIGLREIG
jgi:hypothetical protein